MTEQWGPWKNACHRKAEFRRDEAEWLETAHQFELFFNQIIAPDMFAGKEYYSQSVCLRNVSVTISTTLMKRIYAASNLSRNVRWYHFKSAFFLHIIKGSRKQRRQTEEKTKDKKCKKRKTVGKIQPLKDWEKTNRWFCLSWDRFWLIGLSQHNSFDRQGEERH